MRVLITGSSSLVAKYLVKTAPSLPILTYHWNAPLPSIHMDITNKDEVNKVIFSVEPDVVIHCAAEGAVDKADTEYDIVKKINVEGVRNTVQAANDIGAKYVFLSTNAVFDGHNPPYSPHDERKAVNKYGKLKIEAENEVVASREWLIIRPILLYGTPYSTGRGNLVTRIINNAKSGSTIMSVVDDIISQPTYAGDLAEKIWALVSRKKRPYIIEKGKEDIPKNRLYTNFPGEKAEWNKIYHIANPDTTTLYDFAEAVCEVFDLSLESIKKSKSAEFGCAFVDRPKDTTYDKETMIQCPGIMEGLTAMKNE